MKNLNGAHILHLLFLFLFIFQSINPCLALLVSGDLLFSLEKGMSSLKKKNPKNDWVNLSIKLYFQKEKYNKYYYNV